MDLATLAGVDYADITISGHPFRIGELTQGEWAPVQAWIKATVPGPLSSLASPDFKRLPPDVKREVLGHVLEKDRQSWPPLVGTRGWFLALDHEGGHAVALLAILRKHLPGIALDDCGRIVAEATFAEILPAFAAALGMFGPKSQAPPPPSDEGATAIPTKAKKRRSTRRTTSAKSPTSSSRRTAGRPASSSP